MSITSIGDLSVPRAGASDTAEGESADHALRQAPSPDGTVTGEKTVSNSPSREPSPAPIPSGHPRSAEPWRDWSAAELRAFAAAHPEAVAMRTVEFRRGGHLSDVDVRCIHWRDRIGQVRVTTLDDAEAIGPCTVCADTDVTLGDLCPRCHGTQEKPWWLPAGKTFLESQPTATSRYWTLLKLERA